ncbi:uncharacterized protein LOC128133623 [Lactuca sativa]|uniref:uncharacterized protein LOC128133623 n=1 Tax=Lactuca sativa TaxID=4236 RepID=UPI0022B064E5|nr:uncharacterized protein LOC128133623 [Lactuca sativa]
MSHEDSQTNPINISNSIGSTTRIPILYTQDYEVWAHHFEHYVVGSEDNGYHIWEAIMLGPFIHSGSNTTVKSQKEYNKLVADVDKMSQDEKDKLLCNVKSMRMIRFALQSNTFRLVGSCTTAKEIWDRLKELYSTDEDSEHSIQTLLLSEFGAFEQKPEEKLIQTFNRFNHLLSKIIKHGIERKLIDQKVTFMNGLRPEWMVVVSTVKAHEQFKSYSLAKLVGILKSHESVVTKEAKVIFGMGSLALVSKGKSIPEDEEETDISECDQTSEEYALMISNPKKFARRKIPVNKNQNWQGSYSSEKVKEEAKNSSQKDDEKKEIKLAGDSGYDCNYYHGKNHFAKYCMLRKMAEKKEDKELNLTKNKCFAAKPVSEKINDCNRLIKKEDEIIAECESEVSSEETSVSYKIGLDKIETFIDSKEHKCMLKDILDENDRLKIKSDTIHSFDQSNAKLASENKINLENMSEFDEENEMSEIYVDDVVDCSEFMKSETGNEKPLISENSVEFARLATHKEKKLKEKFVVFQKVQTVPNQVYAAKGVTPRQTAELRVLVEKDNAEGCEDFFWSAPIDNADETIGLSEQTSWRVKGRYVAEPLNKPSSSDKPSTIETKDIPIEPKEEPKARVKTAETQRDKQKESFNMHKSQKQLAEKKRLRNQRYAKNLNEQKSYWNSQNFNYVPPKKISKDNGKEISQEPLDVSVVRFGGVTVSFDDEGPEIIEKQSKKVLLKSERKGEMYPLCEAEEDSEKHQK